MIRIALTAYLCFAAICGPLFCCCALRHANPVQVSRLGTCCGQSAKANHNSQPPTNHVPGSCPCRKHLSLAGAVVPKTDVMTDGTGSVFVIDQLALSASVSADTIGINPAEMELLLNGPPASLAGRDLLRAYQILRC